MQCARTWVLIEAWLLRVAVHAGRPLMYDDERVEFAPSDDKQAGDMSDMSNDVSAPRTPVKTALGEKKLARMNSYTTLDTLLAGPRPHAHKRSPQRGAQPSALRTLELCATRRRGSGPRTADAPDPRQTARDARARAQWRHARVQMPTGAGLAARHMSRSRALPSPQGRSVVRATHPSQTIGVRPAARPVCCCCCNHCAAAQIRTLSTRTATPGRTANPRPNHRRSRHAPPTSLAERGDKS